MSKKNILIHELANGMTLIVEPMAEVSSAAFSFLETAGVAYDPEGRTGTAGVLSEWLFRGAGEMNNRELNEQLDGLGLHRQSSVNSIHSSFSGAIIGDNLLRALEIHSDVLQRPHLAEDQFETCKMLSIQSLDSLEDDPRQKVLLLAKEQFLSYPFGRPEPGKRDELEKLTGEETKSFWASRFSPEGTILAVAGKVDFEEIKAGVERYFGGWKPKRLEIIAQGKAQKNVFHEQNEGAQVHIALIYPSIHFSHPDYYKALAAVTVLSGGMGSRLFTEVREKRGLCYAVGANHTIIGKQGAVQCYVGSSPDKAQEALDVMINELVKLADGISQEELDRAKVGLRASLIMQGESSNARAGSSAGDFYHLGRVRGLEEIEQAILSLTVDDVIDYIQCNRPDNFTVVTLGPKKLAINS